MPSFPDPDRLRQLALAARIAQVERQRREEQLEKHRALAQAVERRRERVHRSRVMRTLREARSGIARASVEGLRKRMLEIPESIYNDAAAELTKLGFQVCLYEEPDRSELLAQVREYSSDIQQTIAVAIQNDLGYPGFYEALSDANELPELLSKVGFSIDTIQELGGTHVLAHSISKQQTRLLRLLKSEGALDLFELMEDPTTLDSDRAAAKIFVQALKRAGSLFASLGESLVSLGGARTTDFSSADESQTPSAPKQDWIPIEVTWSSVDLAEHKLAPRFDAGFVGWISSTSGEGLLIELKSIFQQSAEAGQNACSVDFKALAPNSIRWGENSVRVVRHQDRSIGIFPQTADLFCWLIRCMGFSAEIVNEGGGQSKVTITWAGADPELGDDS